MHGDAEFCEVEAPGAVLVELGKGVVQGAVRERRALHPPHEGAELVDVDDAVAVEVVDEEGLREGQTVGCVRLLLLRSAGYEQLSDVAMGWTAGLVEDEARERTRAA